MGLHTGVVLLMTQGGLLSSLFLLAASRAAFVLDYLLSLFSRVFLGLVCELVLDPMPAGKQVILFWVTFVCLLIRCMQLCRLAANVAAGCMM